MELDFNDIKTVLKILGEAQEAEQDLRENAREAHHFLDKRDGQWEPDVIQRMKGKPRYTFDKCNPIVDQIAGEMEEAEFSIKVRPSGGDASEKTAKTLDGLIRNIRNISNGDHVFNASGRSMITSGFDAWEVVQDWVDADAFDQDLFIRKVPNALDRVWFDPASEMQDRSDARWAVVLQTLTKQQYEDKFPDGSGTSVGDDKRTETYTDKPEFIIVGRILYKKPVKIEIVRMTNGAVYKDDDNFKKVQEELKAQGVEIEKDDKGQEKRRTRDSWRVHSRLFDGQDWLIPEEKTVFDYIPVIPTYGNFKITENKVIFRGVVEKLMDEQRVYNYARSRQIEESALAPRAKYWLTDEQAEGHLHKLQTMNVNPDPVQIYNHVDGHMPPQQQGGAVVNPGIEMVAQAASNDLNASAGLFAANLGDNPNVQSGVAIEKQIDKGNQGTIKWFNAQEIAICHTAKVLINAIPRVYDSTRQIRILGEDGESEMVPINSKVFDEQSQQLVELNNLTVGEYDVVCEMGPAFKNRQQETASAFLEMAGINPELTQRGMDLWLKSISAPGMDLMADRFRESLLQQGVIPFEQMNDDEKAQAQAAAQQPPQPDPAMVLAQAEMEKAQAEQQNAANKQAEIQGNQQISIAQIQLDQAKLDLDAQKFLKGQDDKFNLAAAQIDQGQQKIDQQSIKQMQEMALKLAELESRVGQQLDSEVQSNMLVFDPSTGDFVQGGR